MGKKILGLDLGSNSIGWAFIEEDDKKSSIIGAGVRIVPLSSDEKDQFSKGQAISVNKDRTLKRTARKTNHRYKLRKQNLLKFLQEHNMMPDDDSLKKIKPQTLYGLRARAVHEKIELTDLGRVLLHLNQKRGYKSTRNAPEQEGDKKLSDYLTEIRERKEMLEQQHITIGEYFHGRLSEDTHYRIKENVFPRQCYIDEFNKIWDRQAEFHPRVLTAEKKVHIRDRVIYYQRRLKSQKHLVGKCAFELHHRAAPKSSPLFQVEKIWESVNNLSLKNKYNEPFEINQEKKQELFNFLDTHEKLTASNLLKILGLKKTEGWTPNEQIEKSGIQGNITRVRLMRAFEKLSVERDELLTFEIRLRCDKETGEVVHPEIIDESFEQQPLYRLWHLLYSVDDPELLINALMRDYGFSRAEAEELNKIDFKKLGFGNKSARAMRKLLPGLMRGLGYAEAAKLTGYNHSESLTTEENLNRTLQDRLSQYRRNSLRQPVVEKIMNQLVNIVNAILESPKLGRPDEIRIELARELKQSQEERKRANANNIETDKKHKQIIARIETEYPGIKATRKVIEKWKLFEQQDGICLYSGDKMELAMVLRGDGIDVDHVIPQSRLFDDSFQNKVLAYRNENKKKDNATAFDYLKTKSDEQFSRYIETVNRLFEAGKMTRSKRDKLLMAGSNIPDDFISRQLNETRYITREATRLLKDICHHVHSTSGSVTDFLRNEWGYNEVLPQLNTPKFELAGKVKDGKIEGWSKRDDHRHHAIDALVVAATKQRYIQQLNRLNSRITAAEMAKEIEGKAQPGWQARKSLLEQYIQTKQPFTTVEVKNAVAQIAVSIKPGKKVASLSYNKATGKKGIIPRGQLHKEQVYGKIRRYAAVKTPLNARFKSVDLIASELERKLVAERLNEFENDPKKAFKNLDKNPIWLDAGKTKALREVTLWEEHFVYKYALGPNFNEKDIDSIVDAGVREKVRERFAARKGGKDHPLKNIAEDPIWLNREKRIPITSVRCTTGYSDLVSLHIAEKGITGPKKGNAGSARPVDYVIPRNNHHIALYLNSEGELLESAISLWDAVERKRAGLPVIIADPRKTWDQVFSKGIDQPELLGKLPKDDWKFYLSLQQNEIFAFNITREELAKALNSGKTQDIGRNLYRVQKISASYYVFRGLTETNVDDKKVGGEMVAKKMGNLIAIQSMKALQERNPVKMKINAIGEISLAGQ